ncbi:hypothetical protein ACLB1G_16170 [Oxalobacteraceae bacterium A2-2]
MPRKSANSPEVRDEENARLLAELALDLAEKDQYEELSEEMQQKDLDFQRLVRKLLNQKKDEVLYGAIEHARYDDLGAYAYLREQLQEASGTVILRREGAPEMEINAFAIPLFVHSTGGLDPARDFQDPDAYDALVDSIVQAGLEGPKAKVVLVGHAYDLAEMDRITYSGLHAMVHDAARSLTEKKLAAAPALERSISGWGPGGFAADEAALELRFLVGFALKRSDDPFYKVPSSPAKADAYFEQRLQRFQKWTGQYAPLVQRCLGLAEGRVSFLYQDLFFSAKDTALGEYAVLQLLSALNQGLAAAGVEAAAASAVIVPVQEGGQLALRVLLQAGGATLASADKPLDIAADIQEEIEDLADALESLGLGQLCVAEDLDADGQPVAVHPMPPH